MSLFIQVELINELPDDKTITVYRCGPLVDLCRGPHIPNTSFVKAFKCLKVQIWHQKMLKMNDACKRLLIIFIFSVRPLRPTGGVNLTVKVFRESTASRFLILNASRYLLFLQISFCISAHLCSKS